MWTTDSIEEIRLHFPGMPVDQFLMSANLSIDIEEQTATHCASPHLSIDPGAVGAPDHNQSSRWCHRSRKAAVESIVFKPGHARERDPQTARNCAAPAQRPRVRDRSGAEVGAAAPARRDRAWRIAAAIRATDTTGRTFATSASGSSASPRYRRWKIIRVTFRRSDITRRTVLASSLGAGQTIKDALGWRPDRNSAARRQALAQQRMCAQTQAGVLPEREAVEARLLDQRQCGCGEERQARTSSTSPNR